MSDKDQSDMKASLKEADKTKLSEQVDESIAARLGKKPSDEEE